MQAAEVRIVRDLPQNKSAQYQSCRLCNSSSPTTPRTVPPPARRRRRRRFAACGISLDCCWELFFLPVDANRTVGIHKHRIAVLCFPVVLAVRSNMPGLYAESILPGTQLVVLLTH